MVEGSAELEELVVETVSVIEVAVVVVAEGEIGMGVEALEEGETTGGVGVDEEGRFGANLDKLDTELGVLEALGGYE